MLSAERRTKKSKKALPPLANGDHLDQKTFHERYEAMPADCRAELIGGIVYMASPQKSRHGKHHFRLAHWLGEYEAATPGVEGHINTTQILGDDAEPQPDAGLFVLPEYGGEVWEDEDEYLHGTPEWLGEISDSTESIDLNRKKRDYEIAGVREYMVVAVRMRRVFWFVRNRGKFKELLPDDDGILRSVVFPGLWLDPEALLKRNGRRLLSVLRQGIASPEHAVFVAKLTAKKRG
jgi:Uma2 family endonuclease